MSRTSVLLRVVAIGSLACVPAIADSAKLMDLAPFGSLSSWNDTGEVRRLPNITAAVENHVRNVGIEWREERDIHEVRVQFAATPPGAGVKVQYWSHTWPGPAPRRLRVEDPIDDPWQGQWLTADVTAQCEGVECRYSFKPLSTTENTLAGNMPGVRYRRALKVRIAAGADLPAVRNLSVFSDSVEQPISVRVALGYRDVTSARWTGKVEVSNGRLESVKPWKFEKGDSLQSGGKWDIQSSTTEKGILLNLIKATATLPGSLDRTLVTIRAMAGADDRTFTFDVEDLKSGPIYVPAMHAYAIDATQGEFRPRPGKGPQIRALIPKEPEQSFARASKEIPALDPWQNEKGERIYFALAPDSSWQKFAFEYGGNVFVQKTGTKAKGKELRRLLWDGDRITWRIGTGETPYYRDDRKASVSLQDGYLPVVKQAWDNDGLAYSEEAFATMLRGPMSPNDKSRDEETPAVLMLRLVAENRGSSIRAAHVWLDLDPGEELTVSGKRVHATGTASAPYSSPRLRAVFQNPGGSAPIVEPVPAGSGRKAVHFTFPVAPGARESVILKLPFVSDLTAGDAQEAEALNYEDQRVQVARYWQSIVKESTRFSIPEEKLDLLARAVIWHIRMSTTKDPASGLYMVPAASYRYQVYANEACFQALLLDALGAHDLAAQYLETFLQLQGSKNFPGLHRGMEDAILHGVRVNAEYDYTAHRYGLDHATVLWTLGEHYRYSRDKDWFVRSWPHIAKAVAWVVKQRESTKRTDDNGTKVREYGLLPASSLEDNADWANWFSINSYAWAGLDNIAAALEDLHHPDAARIRSEADAYRRDLRAAVMRCLQEAPVTSMRDGTFAPFIAAEPNQRFRRFGPVGSSYYSRYQFTGLPMMRLSSIREALYGPIILLNVGVFDVNEPIADWILNDWEDNVTLTSGLGMNVHGPTDDRYWFSQGSMVFQPNLQNPILVYLKAHEVPAAIRSLYNNFVSCLYPDANALTEEYHEWGHATGPFYKIPDEAKLINRVRDMLVLEAGDTLYLAGGTPRRWLESRDGVRVDRVATYFGPVSYTMHAAESGVVEASVQLPSRNPARNAWLVARVPKGKIQNVTINGKQWTDIDQANEAIKLPVNAGDLKIRIEYR